jgi:hypothetical protein
LSRSLASAISFSSVGKGILEHLLNWFVGLDIQANPRSEIRRPITLFDKSGIGS